MWAEEVEPLLRSDVEGALKATTILEWLDERHPGRFSVLQLRTLQRRVRDWRALSGPDREVFFEQEHPPGREAQVDFTHCGELGVTVGGKPFGHLLFHFVLSHSGWRYVDVAYGETFAALVKGMQGALWELGGVPEVLRTDNLSAKLEHKRRCLRPLPPAPVPEYVTYRTKVRKWSTVRVANRTYTVPSRLIGMEVDVRQYADHLEVYYKGSPVERMDRVHGAGEAGIDYRHVIGSLVRKPGAFARYRYREQMFPTGTFRLAYDALREWRGERADVDYVRILHLAATTMESEVDRALGLLLEAGTPFDYAAVRELAAPALPQVPELASPRVVDLKVYDGLLAAGVR